MKQMCHCVYKYNYIELTLATPWLTFDICVICCLFVSLDIFIESQYLFNIHSLVNYPACIEILYVLSISKNPVHMHSLVTQPSMLCPCSCTTRTSWTCLTAPRTWTAAAGSPTSRSTRTPAAASTPPESPPGWSIQSRRCVRVSVCLCCTQVILYPTYNL